LISQQLPRSEQPSWDKRSWLIGGVGGVAATFVCIIGASNSIEAAEPLLADVISVIGFGVALIILPVILSWTANRRWLLWPFLPFCILVFMVNVTSWLLPNEFVSPDDSTDPVVLIQFLLGVVVLVLSTVVVLIRLYVLKQCRHKRMLAEARPEPSIMDSAWPPRPTNTDT